MDVKNQSPIDLDLDKLETDIRKLKVEFDIYFSGGTNKPPYDSKNRLESSIKRLYDIRGLNFAQRFRYNSLVARYNIMRELWRRQLQDFEMAGKPPTAEAIAASRNRTIVVRCSDPATEPNKVTELFDNLLIAKRECGERIGNLTIDSFKEFLKVKANQLRKQLGTEEVDFIITVDNGRVRFSARNPKV